MNTLLLLQRPIMIPPVVLLCWVKLGHNNACVPESFPYPVRLAPSPSKVRHAHKVNLRGSTVYTRKITMQWCLRYHSITGAEISENVISVAMTGNRTEKRSKRGDASQGLRGVSSSAQQLGANPFLFSLRGRICDSRETSNGTARKCPQISQGPFSVVDHQLLRDCVVEAILTECSFSSELLQIIGEHIFIQRSLLPKVKGLQIPCRCRFMPSSSR